MSQPADQQIAAFLAKYSPEMAASLSDARQRLRNFFPRGFELVFENYNALVFGFSPSDKASESFVSVVGYPKWVTLFFLNGSSLHDPAGLLEGQGKQFRSVRLKSPAQLNTPELEALIEQAMEPYRSRLAQAPELASLVKLIAPKQRPRRPSSK